MTCSRVKHEVKEIGLRLDMSEGLLGLGIKITLAVFHELGSELLLKQWL